MKWEREKGRRRRHDTSSFKILFPLAPFVIISARAEMMRVELCMSVNAEWRFSSPCQIFFYVKKVVEAAIAYFRQARGEGEREAFVHSSLRVIWNDDESRKMTMMILSLCLVSISENGGEKEERACVCI